jgi:hypothetical protein
MLDVRITEALPHSLRGTPVLHNEAGLSADDPGPKPRHHSVSAQAATIAP